VDDFFGPNRAEYVPKFAVAIYRTLAGLSKAARAQQCSVLLYYCALLKTYKQRIGLYSNMDLHVKVFGRETGLNLFDLDKEIVTAHISSNFMAKVNRNRKNRGLSLDTFHQQKLVVHLCIMTLVLTNFSLDPALKDEFRADIRLSKKELKQAYMMVGAYETKGKKTVLTAPLKLPQLKDRSRF
jgi:hypothetical protein